MVLWSRGNVGSIKKEIRIALGMAADTRFGQIAQGVQGAVQGYQQGTSGV